MSRFMVSSNQAAAEQPAGADAPLLDDGFSMPRDPAEPALPPDPHASAASLEEALASKSDF